MTDPKPLHVSIARLPVRLPVTKSATGARDVTILVDFADAQALQGKYLYHRRDGYVGVYDKATKTVRPLGRYLLGVFERGVFADHINRDKLDHRRSNLRVLTKRESPQNVGPHLRSRSGVRGVHWDKVDQRWRVRFTVTRHGQKVIVRFGSYSSLYEATMVAKAAVKKLFPFAYVA